jgi:adenosylcobinamide amidohydrolase
VNAVATIAEAKTQALRDLGLAATGTSTDAICLLTGEGPDGLDERYGGPRSRWGRPLAWAAYQAILSGGRQSDR